MSLTHSSILKNKYHIHFIIWSFKDFQEMESKLKIQWLLDACSLRYYRIQRLQISKHKKTWVSVNKYFLSQWNMISKREIVGKNQYDCILHEEKKRKRKAKRGLRNLWLQFDMYIYWSNVCKNQLGRPYCVSLFFLSTCRWLAVYDCMQLQENTKN